MSSSNSMTPYQPPPQLLNVSTSAKSAVLSKEKNAGLSNHTWCWFSLQRHIIYLLVLRSPIINLENYSILQIQCHEVGNKNNLLTNLQLLLYSTYSFKKVSSGFDKLMYKQIEIFLQSFQNTPSNLIVLIIHHISIHVSNFAAKCLKRKLLIDTYIWTVLCRILK